MLITNTNFNKRLEGALLMSMYQTISANKLGAEKTIEQTQFSDAFIVNGNAKGYTFTNMNDAGLRLIKSFIAATSTYLGLVKVSSPDTAVALILTDLDGKFKFGSVVEYHENESKDEPGNWSYVMTFNEADIEAISKKKTVKKYLYGDDRFKVVFDKVSNDIGQLCFKNEVYMYDACLLVVDSLLGVLSDEAVEGSVQDVEVPGYITASVEVEGGEKIFAVTPDGAMKELIKGDVSLDK